MYSTGCEHLTYAIQCSAKAAILRHSLHICLGFVPTQIRTQQMAHLDEFVWGRILNKCAVISPDKQNNDRKMSDCLSLTRRLFIYLCILNDHWILFLHSFTFKYVITNKTWLRESILNVNGDRHIFPPKKTHVVWKIEIITAIFSQT